MCGEQQPARHRHYGLIYKQSKLAATRINTGTKKMSTPNFYCKNTSKIYVIESNEDYAAIDCQSILEDSHWESCDEYDRECNNSYPASIIAEKTKSLYIGGTSIDITAKAKTVSGYYSGSCFDFDCEGCRVAPLFDWWVLSFLTGGYLGALIYCFSIAEHADTDQFIVA